MLAGGSRSNGARTASLRLALFPKASSGSRIVRRQSALIWQAYCLIFLPFPPPALGELMSKDKTVLVCGVGETASAAARRLFLEGYSIALFRTTAPRVLRRRMAFSDAWYDSFAQLEGVETRRADVNGEYLLGLQTRSFIPMLRQRFQDVVGFWPWDVIVAVEEDAEPTPTGLRDLAELTIGIGPSFSAGVNCDLVVETEGADPGAILRPGETPQGRRPAPEDGVLASAPRKGLFRASVSIGMTVEAGEPLGLVEDTPVLAPAGGRLRGVARREAAVTQDAQLAEIAFSRTAQVAGVSERNQLVSRGVAFAIEMESEGWEPFSFEKWV
jgi:xanthine dehydrogenase accessory factor